MAETITINLDTAARGPAGADGAATFTALTDAPSSYAGQGLKLVRVNSGGTALEFVTASGTGDALVSGTLDQFADVTQTSGATLAISASTTLNGGTHSGTNTGDQDLSSYVTLTGTQTLTNKSLTAPALGTPLSGNFSSGTFTWPTFNQSTTGNAATVTTINGRIAEGTNVTFTGTGTAADPYVISAAGGGGGGTWGSITGALGDQTDLQAALDLKMASDPALITEATATAITNEVSITFDEFDSIPDPAGDYPTTIFHVSDSDSRNYEGSIIGRWKADTTSTGAVPGTGDIRWNNATQTIATELYIDQLTQGSANMAAMIGMWFKGDRLLLMQDGSPANYQVWSISAAPSVSSGDWTVPVTLVTSAGTGTTGFADNLKLVVGFRGAGNPALIANYMAEQTLTDGATVTYDTASGCNAVWTIGGNRTLSIPTNTIAGQSGRVVITQDGTGGHALTLAAGWGLTTANLADVGTMAAAEICVLSWTRLTSTTFASTLIFL
jgi:hypothetical protein